MTQPIRSSSAVGMPLLRSRCLASLVGIMSVLWIGCGYEVDCHNAFDQLPETLLEQNEYVLACTLMYVDTLASLGHTVFYEVDFDNYLLEYAFRPVKSVKGRITDSVVFLWHRTTWNRENMYCSGLRASTGTLELLYGNRLRIPGERLNILRPWTITSHKELREILDDERPVDDISVEEDDLTVASRLLKLESLENHFLDSKVQGPVIYGTDHGYQNHSSFHGGLLHCCDSNTFQVKRFTSSEYPDELVRLAGKFH